VLKDIGMDVTLIPAEKLGSEDLSRYQTIVLGIRAYDTQKDVVANNQRLLDFVQAGGRWWCSTTPWGTPLRREISIPASTRPSRHAQPGAGFG